MFIKNRDALIFATSFGAPNLPTILGVGGWTGDSDLWVQPFSAMSPRWRTIAYDHRGTGATTCPVESITVENMVDDVFAVMDAFGVEKCVLAAESAGAITALSAALQRPDRFTGLVLADGMYFSPTPPERNPFIAGLRANYGQTLAAFVNNCLPEPDSAHINRWGLQILGRASQEAAIQLLIAAASVDVRPRLGEINLPTLVIHGEKDVIVPLEASQWLAQAMPNARLEIFEGAGHVPTMTFPEKVAERIEAFFG